MLGDELSPPRFGDLMVERATLLLQEYQGVKRSGSKLSPAYNSWREARCAARHVDQLRSANDLSEQHKAMGGMAESFVVPTL